MWFGESLENRVLYSRKLYSKLWSNPLILPTIFKVGTSIKTVEDSHFSIMVLLTLKLKEKK